MVMPPGAGSVMTRAAAVVPVVLIVLFTGLLWLLGLMCGRDRRRYVTDLSQQAMGAIGVLLHGSPALPPPPAPRSRTGQR
jgi:fumarate reductase subunit D